MTQKNTPAPDLLVQQRYLRRAKKTLSRRQQVALTWDEVSNQCGIHPRALKSYRLPADSAGYRAMSKPVRRAIDALLKEIK